MIRPRIYGQVGGQSKIPDHPNPNPYPINRFSYVLSYTRLPPLNTLSYPLPPLIHLRKGKAAAIRNSRYKLMHTFDSKWSGAWYIADEEYELDDDFTQYGTSNTFRQIVSIVYLHIFTLYI